MVQYVDGTPTVITTPPDAWPQLPSTLIPTTSTSDSWSLSFDSISDLYDLKARIKSPLADYYRDHIRSTLEQLTKVEGRKFGALIMEPTCLGAGGMVFVDPLFQACLVEVVRSSSDLFGGEAYKDNLEGAESQESGIKSKWRGLPVIYDEGESVLEQLGSVSLINTDLIPHLQCSLGYTDSDITLQPLFSVTTPI